jgi:hypothetical protein
MTSDSGVAKQYSDYARQIQETLDELQHMQETPRLVTSPDELEALEREIRQRGSRSRRTKNNDPYGHGRG